MTLNPKTHTGYREEPTSSSCRCGSCSYSSGTTCTCSVCNRPAIVLGKPHRRTGPRSFFPSFTIHTEKFSSSTNSNNSNINASSKVCSGIDLLITTVVAIIVIMGSNRDTSNRSKNNITAVLVLNSEIAVIIRIRV